MAAQETLFDLPAGDGAGNDGAADGKRGGLPADPFLAAVPGWLADRLEGPDGVNPLRRSAYAKLVPCSRCRSPALRAADMALDLMGDSQVDPAILRPGEELTALLAGRYTAELEVNRHGRGITVYRRDRWLIAKPAGSRGRFAVPEHRCYEPLGVPLPFQMLYPQLFAQIHNPERGTNEPPF